jgi:hypothetical protein
MNHFSLALLLFAQVFGTEAIAAPVPKHLFPKPEAEPVVVEAPLPAPLPQFAEEQARVWANQAQILAEIKATKKAIAAGTYVAPPRAPGTVILQSGRAEIGVPLPDRNQAPHGK